MHAATDALDYGRHTRNISSWIMADRLAVATNPSYGVTHCAVRLSVCPSVCLFVCLRVFLSCNQAMFRIVPATAVEYALLNIIFIVQRCIAVD